jgi:hypothetical protein
VIAGRAVEESALVGAGSDPIPSPRALILREGAASSFPAPAKGFAAAFVRNSRSRAAKKMKSLAFAIRLAIRSGERLPTEPKGTR